MPTEVPIEKIPRREVPADRMPVSGRSIGVPSSGTTRGGVRYVRNAVGELVPSPSDQAQSIGAGVRNRVDELLGKVGLGSIGRSEPAYEPAGRFGEYAVDEALTTLLGGGIGKAAQLGLRAGRKAVVSNVLKTADKVADRTKAKITAPPSGSRVVPGPGSRSAADRLFGGAGSGLEDAMDVGDMVNPGAAYVAANVSGKIPGFVARGVNFVTRPFSNRASMETKDLFIDKALKEGRTAEDGFRDFVEWARRGGGSLPGIGATAGATAGGINVGDREAYGKGWF